MLRDIIIIIGVEILLIAFIASVVIYGSFMAKAGMGFGFLVTIIAAYVWRIKNEEKWQEWKSKNIKRKNSING